MATGATISLSLSLHNPGDRAILRGMLDAADGLNTVDTETTEPKRRGRPVKTPAPRTDAAAPAPAPVTPAGNGDAPPIPAPPAPELPSGEVKLTMEKLREAFTAYVRAKGTPHGISLLKSFGVERVANLPEDKWQEFFDKLVA